MNLSRPYPAACLSWLSVPQAISGPAMAAKLRFRDQALADDPHASGEPPGFADWAIKQVQAHRMEPAIAKQIEARRLQLQTEGRRLEERFACAFTELEVAAAKLDDQLRVLDQLEAGA